MHVADLSSFTETVAKFQGLALRALLSQVDKDHHRSRSYAQSAEGNQLAGPVVGSSTNLRVTGLTAVTAEVPGY